MARDWEAQFRQWAKPPGKTEQDRCDNATSMVRNAIKASQKLHNRDISIFLQGSYRNNTNVRKDSDVDIVILCTDSLFNDYPPNMTREDFDLDPSTYSYGQYKNEVEEALFEYFGRPAVKRGNKAFDIHETSYHVEADIATFFEHRRYRKDGTYYEGVALLTDKEQKRIINWPEQHYHNGVYKNTNTGTRFKSVVRVLKSLAVEMTEKGIRAADIPGFLIECLVWKAPNDNFQNPNYISDVRGTLAFLFNNTRTQEACKDWGEVSDFIYLFHPSQKWTYQEAHAFTSVAWDYIGFEG